MANQSGPQISGRKDIITQITDENGTVIVEIGSHEYSIKNADGSRTYRQIYETIVLMCGMVWAPAMMTKVPIGICEHCRRKGKTGLVSILRGRRCVECGKFTCPAHHTLGRDGKYRCSRHCNTIHQLKSLLRPLLFKREEG